MFNKLLASDCLHKKSMRRRGLDILIYIWLVRTTIILPHSTRTWTQPQTNTLTVGATVTRDMRVRTPWSRHTHTDGLSNRSTLGRNLCEPDRPHSTAAQSSRRSLCPYKCTEHIYRHESTCTCIPSAHSSRTRMTTPDRSLLA